MKYFIGLILCSMCVSLQLTCFAKGIVGKWHCPKEVTTQLNLGYEDLQCTYKFKRNGSFVLKITGETLVNLGKYTNKHNHFRRGYIVLKGQYKIENGLISSIVENKDIECFADETEDYIYDTDRTPASLYVMRNNNQDSYKKSKALLLRKSLLEYRFLWDWDNESVKVSDKEISIGDTLICVR